MRARPSRPLGPLTAGLPPRRRRRHISRHLRFPGGSVVRNPPASAGDAGSVGKTPWRRKRQPTPVFSPGDSHGPRRLAGSRARGHEGLDTSELAHAHAVCATLLGQLELMQKGFIVFPSTFLKFILCFLAMQRPLWDLSFVTKDGAQALGSESRVLTTGLPGISPPTFFQRKRHQKHLQANE